MVGFISLAKGKMVMNSFNQINFNSGSLQRAVAKAVAVRPHVRLGLASSCGAAYFVRRSDGASFAQVQFIRSARGSALVSCDCDAGARVMLCYHAAAALIVHVSLVRSGFRSSISSSVWLPRSSGRGFYLEAA
jgi:hypothetical protein